jgi:integrase
LEVRHDGQRRAGPETGVALVTLDGLVIRKAKFNKTRLVQLHPTAIAALNLYLDVRRRTSTVSDYLFISPKGEKLPYPTVSMWFRRLAQGAGLRQGKGARGPRIHDLRHTFAVRALQSAPVSASPVGPHVRALSTYLGHTHVADTCWYLHATPQLMRGVADACERFLEGAAS